MRPDTIAARLNGFKLFPDNVPAPPRRTGFAPLKFDARLMKHFTPEACGFLRALWADSMGFPAVDVGGATIDVGGVNRRVGTATSAISGFHPSLEGGKAKSGELSVAVPMMPKLGDVSGRMQAASAAATALPDLLGDDCTLRPSTPADFVAAAIAGICILSRCALPPAATTSGKDLGVNGRLALDKLLLQMLNGSAGVVSLVDYLAEGGTLAPRTLFEPDQYGPEVAASRMFLWNRPAVMLAGFEVVNALIRPFCAPPIGNMRGALWVNNPERLDVTPRLADVWLGRAKVDPRFVAAHQRISEHIGGHLQPLIVSERHDLLGLLPPDVAKPLWGMAERVRRQFEDAGDRIFFSTLNAEPCTPSYAQPSGSEGPNLADITTRLMDHVEGHTIFASDMIRAVVQRVRDLTPQDAEVHTLADLDGAGRRI